MKLNIINHVQTLIRNQWITRCMNNFHGRSVSNKSKYKLRWEFVTNYNHYGFFIKICKYLDLSLMIEKDLWVTWSIADSWGRFVSK